MTYDVKSPCVRNCCLDENDICLGCFRTLKEITQWASVTKEEREQIVENAKQRKKERVSHQRY